LIFLVYRFSSNHYSYLSLVIVDLKWQNTLFKASNHLVRFLPTTFKPFDVAKCSVFFLT
jgi:hypothetical protein